MLNIIPSVAKQHIAGTRWEHSAFGVIVSKAIQSKNLQILTLNF